MIELPPRPTALAQRFLSELLKGGEVVIDATAGNGHDTVFLAGLVGDAGQVLSFDVQEAAIASAKERVNTEGLNGQVQFFCDSHARLGERVSPESVAAVMFNLGYLPGADHAVATGNDTIAALEAAAVVLRKGGALSVVCYPGHEGGDTEATEVEAWMSCLPEKGWRVAKYGAIGTKRPAPFLLFGLKG